MDAKFKLITFTDEFLAPSASLFSRLVRWPWPLRWVLPPLPRESSECLNYVLGFQFVPTERELMLIRQHNLFSRIAVTIRETDPSLTLADVLGPEFVPEVSASLDALLRTESLVRRGAAIWSHYLEAIPDAK
jgi:hypothetical protein